MSWADGERRPLADPERDLATCLIDLILHGILTN